MAIGKITLRLCYSAVIAAFFLQTATAAPAESTSVASTEMPERFQTWLNAHCSKCHDGEKPEGKLHLAQLSQQLSDPAVRARWNTLIEKLEAGEMPPPERPRPAEHDVRALLEWIKPRVTAAEAADRAAQGRVPLRRLNRIEFENTIRDLFGIQVSLKDKLPLDGAADGFDNAAAAHHTSAFLMEKYLEAIETALNAAISNHPRQPPLFSKRLSLKDGHPIRTTKEDVYRFLDDGEVVCFCSSAWHDVSVLGFYPPHAGKYRFRISASAVQSDGKPVTFRVTASDTRLTGKDGLIGYFDAPADKPEIFEFVREMKAQSTIRILPYGLAGADAVKKAGSKDWQGRGLAVQYVEIEGPLHDTWPPASHRQLLGELPRKTHGSYNFRDRVEVVSDQPEMDAERILKNFVRRAFRRTIRPADVEPYLSIFKQKHAAGYTFEMALRAAFKGVLLSPEFLFLRERAGKLDDDALAVRLSYFLWSTMPDDDLFALAENKQLHRPEVLRQQVERMLADPKAEAFTENFVGQWLGLREIDATEPSHLLYPEYDHLLKVSMIREAELFFQEILTHDLSLLNFVDADFTLLNQRLAKHYGVPGPDGWKFKKVTLPPEAHRGGVLTMAGVLKVTANGTTTSPVLRGAWILDRILGTPAPPPPENISAIDPDIRGATTIREQLAKHRSVESCAVCHRQIDPPGFALESFDCIGGWRENYRVTGKGETVVIDGRRMSYHRGKKIDPSDVTADGVAFSNIDEFKKLLLRDKPLIARALANKLMAYATGRAPQVTDQPAVETIVKKLEQHHYGLRTLIHEIVQSELFQQK